MTEETLLHADAIVSMETLPQQIDHISASMHKKVRIAGEYIDKLPEEEKEEANQYIQNRVEAYYEPSILGSDNQMYSVASLDNMF